MTYESTPDQESNLAAAEHRAAQRARMPKFYAVMDTHAHRSMQQTIQANRAAGIERAYQRDLQRILRATAA